MATAGSLMDSSIPGVLATAGGSVEPADHETGGKYAKGIISRIYKQVDLFVKNENIEIKKILLKLYQIIESFLGSKLHNKR